MQAIFAKIIAFFMSILAFFGLVKPADGPARFDGDFNVTVTEEKIEFQLDANATTGYQWGYFIDGDAVEMTDEHYEVYEHEAGMVGVGGVQFFTFTAVKPGRATVTFNYAQNWKEGDAKTLVFRITVSEDMSITYETMLTEEA